MKRSFDVVRLCASLVHVYVHGFSHHSAVQDKSVSTVDAEYSADLPHGDVQKIVAYAEISPAQLLNVRHSDR